MLAADLVAAAVGLAAPSYSLDSQLDQSAPRRVAMIGRQGMCRSCRLIDLEEPGPDEAHVGQDLGEVGHRTARGSRNGPGPARRRPCP
jgi:hypothetical protein